MLEHLPNLLAPKFIILYAFIASAMYVHYRGRVRHRFYRQLTDHSTFMAPYNVLMYMFSAVPNGRTSTSTRFPSSSRCRDNWQMIRDEALQLFDDGHIRAAAKYNDLGFNSFFRRGWKRFYVKWYDEPLPSAKALCPKTVALVQSIPSVNARDVRAAAARRQAGQASRSVRRLAALSPGPVDAELATNCRIFVDGEPYSLARRRGGDVRRDVHPLGGEQDRYAARHPVLRRRAAADQPHHGARSITGTRRR